VRGRKILDVTFGLLVASFGSYALVHALFPRLHNEMNCDNSTPTTSAQLTGLERARSRKKALCAASQEQCQFVILDDPGGSFRVALYLVETNFFEGCIFKYQDPEVFVYSREGELVRIEGAPYG